MIAALPRGSPGPRRTKQLRRGADIRRVKGVDPGAALKALVQLEQTTSTLKRKLGERTPAAALIAPALTIAKDLRRGTLERSQLGGAIGQELAALAGGDLGGKLGAVAGFLLAPLSLPVVIAGSVLGAYFGRRGGRALARRLTE